MLAQELISVAYSAFNQRDIDAALELMSEDVSWPKASEGGRVVGKREIRDYWRRQWADFDPRVDVLEVVDGEAGKVDVKVHQLVRNLEGDVLSDTELWHVYTIANGLIERMDIKAGDGSSEGPSAAFSGSVASPADANQKSRKSFGLSGGEAVPRRVPHVQAAQDERRKERGDAAGTAC